MARSDNFVELEGFMTLRDAVPFPLRGDAYTVAGEAIASRPAKARSVYNLTNRRSPAAAWPGVARDGRMVLYGISDWVRECLRPGSLDGHSAYHADLFMDRCHSFGGRLNFDPDVWGRLWNEFGGNLPARVEALPEGSTFWPNEPVVQVTSLGEGYGEVAALLEAHLLGMVSCATARATVTRHLLDRMVDEVRTDEPALSHDQALGVASWMVHDFGMRASSTPLEAEIFGRAHLLSFSGTDTTTAAYSAWLDSDDEEELGPVGTSILAHAHRIILGYDTEGEAVRALADAAEAAGGEVIASYLADTFDFRDFVEKLAVPLALEYKRRGSGTVAVRPDSGDYIRNDIFVTLRALEAGLCTRAEGGRARAAHLKIIHGDSMTPEKMTQVLAWRRQRHLHATSWGGFGVGGWLRAQGNRDILSSAYKLAAKGPEGTPVVKLSETEAKLSVPGEVDLRRPAVLGRPTVYPRGSCPSPALVTYYDGSKPGDEAYGDALFESFPARRARARSEFEGYRFLEKDRGGPEAPALSDTLRDFQRAVYAAHKK